jgi:hypothetical protein
MRTRTVLMVAMVLALALAIPGVSRADWDDRPDPSEFEESLSPSGYWVDDATFGIEPFKLQYRVFDWTIGRRFFRNWLDESLDAMQRVAAERTEPRASVD